MSTPTSRKDKLPVLSLHTDFSSTRFNPSPDDRPFTPSSLASTLARLRLNAYNLTRNRSIKSMDQGQSLGDGNMSASSPLATAVESMPPLPLSASELTLAQSTPGSANPAHDETPTSAISSLSNRKSLFFLRKKTSKGSISAQSHDGADEPRGPRRTENVLRRRGPSHRTKDTSSEISSPRPTISPPFNFHHVTHAMTNHLSSPEKSVSLDDISIVPGSRAKQPGGTQQREKTGNLSAPASAIPVAVDSPRRPGQSLQISRSIDSFKRVSRGSFSAPQPPAISPPPRRSSRRPPQISFTVNRAWEQESPTLPTFSSATASTRGSAKFSSQSPRSPAVSPFGINDSSTTMSGIAQAVTTPGATACVVNPDLASPLEDVPEEDDTSSQQQAEGSPAGTAERIQNQRMLRSGSDPVLPQAVEHDEDIPQHAPRRVSGRIADGVFLDLDWDEDINYCYDQLEAEGAEAEIPTADIETDSPVSDSELLYMRDRRASKRLSHLRRASGRLSQGVVRLELPSEDADPVASVPLSPSFEVNEEHCLTEVKKAALPLFTPDMAVVRPFSSPRSSGSPLSKYPSDASFNATATTTTTHTSGLMSGENISTMSVPDLIPSSNRKSSSTTHSSLYSQPCTPAAATARMPALTIDSIPALPSTPKGNIPSAGTRETIALLETGRPAARKRSFTDSCPQLRDNASKHDASIHTRSTSYALLTGASKSPKANYCLFPPLDRIGATQARA